MVVLKVSSPDEDVEDLRAHDHRRDVGRLQRDVVQPAHDRLAMGRKVIHARPCIFP